MDERTRRTISSTLDCAARDASSIKSLRSQKQRLQKQIAAFFRDRNGEMTSSSIKSEEAHGQREDHDEAVVNIKLSNEKASSGGARSVQEILLDHKCSSPPRRDISILSGRRISRKATKNQSASASNSPSGKTISDSSRVFLQLPNSAIKTPPLMTHVVTCCSSQQLSLSQTSSRGVLEVLPVVPDKSSPRNRRKIISVPDAAPPLDEVRDEGAVYTPTPSADNSSLCTSKDPLFRRGSRDSSVEIISPRLRRRGSRDSYTLLPASGGGSRDSSILNNTELRRSPEVIMSGQTKVVGEDSSRKIRPPVSPLLPDRGPSKTEPNLPVTEIVVDDPMYSA